MNKAALLTTALLFGAMILYSFGFAVFLFTVLPPETAGRTIRRAFPRLHERVPARERGVAPRPRRPLLNI